MSMLLFCSDPAEINGLPEIEYDGDKGSFPKAESKSRCQILLMARRGGRTWSFPVPSP